jgi:hypothetical protein
MSDGTTVDLGAALAGGATGTTLLILGTYPADLCARASNHALPATAGLQLTAAAPGLSILCSMNSHSSPAAT